MPSVTKLMRLAALPETRHLLSATARSEALRDLAHRARSDRAGLVRDLRDPAVSVGLVRGALAHPATREIATLSFVLLPERYLLLGWMATRMSRRVLHRSGDGSKGWAERDRHRAAPKNVTPGGPADGGSRTPR
jgi:hypothetical protein